MSFENQMCDYCRKICYCVDVRSLDFKPKNNKNFACEFCLGFQVGSASLKDKITEIMINCGIENIERT